MAFEVRSIYVLTREEIIAMARQQAEAFLPMEHGYATGSTHACTFERAYQERRRELDSQGAELV